MKRRDFLRTAGGTTAAVAGGSGAAAAQEDGGTEEVVVGPGGNFVFEPDELEVAPGTTVTWVWDSDNHNIAVTGQPEEANWEGHETIEDGGFEYEHTFEVLGEYNYVCEPHESAGMVGKVIVTEEPGGAGGGGGGGEKDLHDLGVPIQAHWVGISTILMILVSLVFTFYVLKYGESPNTGNTGGRE